MGSPLSLTGRFTVTLADAQIAKDPENLSLKISEIQKLLRGGQISLRALVAASVCGHEAAQEIMGGALKNHIYPGLELLNLKNSIQFGLECVLRVSFEYDYGISGEIIDDIQRFLKGSVTPLFRRDLGYSHFHNNPSLSALINIRRYMCDPRYNNCKEKVLNNLSTCLQKCLDAAEKGKRRWRDSRAESVEHLKDGANGELLWQKRRLADYLLQEQ